MKIGVFAKLDSERIARYCKQVLESLGHTVMAPSLGDATRRPMPRAISFMVRTSPRRAICRLRRSSKALGDRRGRMGVLSSLEARILLHYSWRSE